MLYTKLQPVVIVEMRVHLQQPSETLPVVKPSGLSTDATLSHWQALVLYNTESNMICFQDIFQPATVDQIFCVGSECLLVGGVRMGILLPIVQENLQLDSST